MMEELKLLHQTYRLFDQLHRELEKFLKTPICIACGACCEVNNLGINAVEAKYIANWLSRQKPDFQRKIFSICESWLTDRIKRDGQNMLVVNGGIGTSLLKDEGIDRVLLESKWLTFRTPCPMLENSRCLIYPARPTVCRAFGVTRTASPKVCKRPPAPDKGEVGDIRFYIKEDHPKAVKVRENLERINSIIENSDYYLKQTLFIPTFIMLEMRPQRLYAMLYENEIPSAKLINMRDTAIIWQSKLEERLDVEREIGSLVDPFGVALGEDPTIIEQGGNDG